MLIVACPKITEFCVPLTIWYVGLSFCMFAPRNWLKWFSTTSWFTIAGLINDPEKRANFEFTKEMKPSTIDCRSNHVLSNKNSLGEDAFNFQLIKYWRAYSNCKRRLSFTSKMACLSENSCTITLVWVRKLIVASSLCESSPVELRWSLYMHAYDKIRYWANWGHCAMHPCI